MSSSASRSERRHAAHSEDQRGTFEHDRDRILYSSALRRLAGVTQVVSADEGHVVHNRLTHSMKVAQLARRIAEHQVRVHESDGVLDAVGGVHPEVAEAAALAHDLGHPPFGHVAEDELSDLLGKQPNNDDRFEGNAQSFRILTKLETRWTDVLGLNLTRATLAATLKYPNHRHPSGPDRKKYGYYEATEKDDFIWATNDSPTPQRTAEAEIMDWADDVTFSVHDMEDFYRAGRIPLHRLGADEDEQLFFLNDVKARWTRQGRRESWDEHREAFLGLARTYLDSLPSTPYRGTPVDRANLRHLTSSLISRFVPAFDLVAPTASHPRCCSITGERKKEVTILKELVWTYVIENPGLGTQQQGHRRIVRELFQEFHDAIEKKQRWRLPLQQQHVIESDGTAGRRAADVICSLTDHEALVIYRTLLGVDPGRIL